MGYTWGVAYAFLFAYRTAATYFGYKVVAVLTVLGDSGTYSTGGFPPLSVSLVDTLLLRVSIHDHRTLATEITKIIGSSFKVMFFDSTLMVHIAFQAVAFAGILYLLLSVPARQRSLLFIFFLFPSFTLWSSVAGKEAIVVLAVCVFAVQLIRLIVNQPVSIGLLVASLLVITIYKGQYLPGILFAVGTVLAARHVHKKTFLVLVSALVSLALLYLVRNTVDELAFQIIPNFQFGGTTRLPFWDQRFDVFGRAPYGMFLAFVGPTFVEAKMGILQVASLVESSILIVLFATCLLGNLTRIPVFMLILSGMTMFWILFANYPLGVMNPGTAIRYRTGYEPLLFVCVVTLFSRSAFVQMISRDRHRATKNAKTKFTK